MNKLSRLTQSAVIKLIKNSNTHEELEEIGEQLKVDQIRSILSNWSQINEKEHWKLAPIFVGLSPGTFNLLLYEANDQEFKVIQQEAVTEPIQHHLTEMAHFLNHRIDEISSEVQMIHDEIVATEIETASSDDFYLLFDKIELLKEFFLDTTNLIDKALKISWERGRIDLVEAFNQSKKSCQNCVKYGTGDGKNQTGLHKDLSDHFFFMFESENYHDPALEGLTKFSLWYLKDYWDLGLLPMIEDRDELDEKMHNLPEKKRNQKREKLFLQVQKELKKHGLLTIADLVANAIFSKKTLSEFIYSR